MTHGTMVHQTETTGGALVTVTYEHHVDRQVGTDRWLYRVVCEMCNDVHTTRAEQDSLELAASKAGFHAGLCTPAPTYRLVTA